MKDDNFDTVHSAALREAGGPVSLVNRGWIGRMSGGADDDDRQRNIAVSAERNKGHRSCGIWRWKGGMSADGFSAGRDAAAIRPAGRPPPRRKLGAVGARNWPPSSRVPHECPGKSSRVLLR